MTSFAPYFLSYNTMGAPFKPKISSRFQSISNQIHNLAQNHDLQWACLQETFVESLRDKHLLTPWEKQHKWSACGNRAGRHLFGGGLSTLSKLSILKSEFCPFSKGAGVDWFVRKGVLHTRLALDDKHHIDVYNSHTQASYISQERLSHCRVSQVQELLSFIIETHDSSAPILLMGDLNCEEYNKEYDMIMNNGEFEFEDVMRTLYPDTDKQALKTLIKKDPNNERKLDHVFLKLGEGWSWDPGQSELEIRDLELSDHRAVLAKVHLTVIT